MGMCTTQKTTQDKVSVPKRIKPGQLSSNILSTAQQHQHFEQYISPLLAQIHSKKSLNFQLVFRASENNYQASEFHSACDGVDNTIILAKTSQNRIFGAYSPCTWRKDVLYKYEDDQKQDSFLFSLSEPKDPPPSQQRQQKKKQGGKSKVKPTIHKIVTKQKAIMNHSECGPIFGEGHDLYISDRCNKNHSWSNLGQTYRSQYLFGSIKANCTLTGESKFIIVEYEVWRIVFGGGGRDRTIKKKMSQ